MKPPDQCPVCTAAIDTRPIERHTAQEAADFFVPRTRSEERNRRLVEALQELWPESVCEVYECSGCGFGFGWPFKGGDELFYSIIHQAADYPRWRWEYAVAAGAAQRLFPGGGKVLDVGAGHGVFRKSLPPGWEYYAAESTDMMRAKLEQAGAKVFRDLDEAGNRAPGTFQFAVLFQVIEHVAPPVPMLRQIRKLMATGGVLAVSTPNNEEIPRRYKATLCPEMPPNHINRWTPKALARALADAGFEQSEVMRQPPAAKNILYSAYLRALTRAGRNPRSLPAAAYRIKNKKLRAAALAPVGGLMIAEMLPHLGAARLSVNMLCLSRAV
ncbi:MAG: class I SAM-dependent methyltransferase [Phycisphaerales bacterium]|nr:class I SAM-dependent methyltransferase [Phycisphaerales bacterium]